ncbi:MAG TPA: (Fe-S)-binding protein, partial [Gaiellaceae bacterium]|nr:(Fe-S)-binding protein [Gaiellaceae bacterium]
HLAHAQGVRAEPRALLAQIPGVELVEPAEWELCCGSAGLYNVLQPEAAAALGRRKAANLLATGADVIAAANPGCALQLRTYLEEAGRPLPIVHPLELVRASIGAVTRS